MVNFEAAIEAAPPALAAALSNRPRYEVQEDKNGKLAVIRFSPKNSKRVINTYPKTDMGHTAALTLRATLTVFASDE